MKKGTPKLNLGFFKDGLKINSKQFHPLNMSFGKDLKLESDKTFKAVDPMDLLETLDSLNVENASKSEKINVLKTMLDKINP